LSASAASKTRARSANASSVGTTPSIAIPASGGTRHTTSTMDTPRRSTRHVPTYSPPPTPATPNGSCVSTPSRPPYPPRRGSTNQPTTTRTPTTQRIPEKVASKILTRGDPDGVEGQQGTEGGFDGVVGAEEFFEPGHVHRWWDRAGRFVDLDACGGVDEDHLAGLQDDEDGSQAGQC